MEFYNMNSSIINSFIQNSSVPVPAPLNCPKGLAFSLVQIINYNVAIIESNLNITSPSPKCESLYNEFKAFKDTWFLYVNELRHNTISKTFKIYEFEKIINFHYILLFSRLF
jgi:hypothetical protein